MKKGLKTLLVTTLGIASVLAMTGCGAKHVGEANKGVTANEDGTYTVRVGNTNASALLPTVFGPMEYGFEAYAWYYGEHENEGKVKVEFKHLDDGYVPATRLANTQQLFEGADECFGIMYGYDDQANLVDQYNKVMVYTPLTMDYYAEAKSTEAEDIANYFPVQPIDYVEGKQLIASAFAKGEAGFGATKVGVIAGKGTTGVDEVKAMRDEAKVLGKEENKDFFIQVLDNAATTDPTAAVTTLKNAGCDVVIITDATYIFLTSIGAIVAAQWANVKVLASYKLSNSAYLGAAYAMGILGQDRGLYTPGWISTVVCENDWIEYIKVMTLYSQHKNDGKITTSATNTSMPAFIAGLAAKYDWAKDGVSAYFEDSYCMAGYEGMHVFCQGLTRLYKAKLLNGASTEDYIAQMEKEEVTIPMSSIKVSYADGERQGARSMALVTVTEANHTLGENYRGFYDIPALEKACK